MINNIKRIIGIFFFFLLASICNAEPTTTPFLWKVTSIHQPALKPTYLFGTIHSGHPELNQLSPATVAAFKQADAFYAELDMRPATMANAAQAFIAPGNQSLFDQISADRQVRINNIMTNISPGLSLRPLARFKLWAFIATLSLIEDQVRYGANPAMDIRLFESAMKNGKIVGGLETLDEQTTVFESFSEVELTQMLDATLDYMEAAQAEGREIMADTYDAYRSGETKEFESLLEKQMQLSSTLNKKLVSQLLVSRNLRMTERIADLIASNTDRGYFFAIGAAHFSGKQGIQQLLKKKGYTITRIKDN